MSIVISTDDSEMRILLFNGYFSFSLFILKSPYSTLSLKKSNKLLKLRRYSEICQRLLSDLVLRFLEDGLTIVSSRSNLSNKVHFKKDILKSAKKLTTKLSAVIRKN